MRIAHSLSISSGLLVATLVACSSSKTGGDKMNGSGGSGSSAGNGAIIEDGGRGGTSSVGTAGNPGRAGSSGVAGSSSSGGVTGTGGGCLGTPNTCLDADTVQYCNTDTNQLETLVCADLAEEGFTSSGCTASLEGESCAIDDVADEACAMGAAVGAYCFQLTEGEQVNVYVNCFQDNQGAHEVVLCMADYFDEAVAPDCTAVEACIPATTDPVPPAP